MFIDLRNSITGEIKQVKLGFSWTTFFFGFFPALFRMDWLNFLIMVGAAFLTCGLSWIVFPFIYNTMYIKKLLRDGYLPATKTVRDVLISKGLGNPAMMELQFEE